MRIALLILALIFIPLIESGYSQPLWGVKWYSPLFMDVIGDWLLVIKCIAVTIGLAYLSRYKEELKTLIPAKLLYYPIVLSVFTIGALQFLFLSMGLLTMGFGASLEEKHRAKHYDNLSIYVLTSDPGAMGSAYHSFFIQCPKTLSFYDLTLIIKIDWLRDFDFHKQGNMLIVSASNTETMSFDLSEFDNCH